MVFVVYLVVEFFTQFVRVYMIYPKIKLRMVDYLTQVMSPICFVSVISVIICFAISKYVVVNSLWMLLLISIAYIMVTMIVIFILGLNKLEKQYIYRFINKKI